MPKTPLFVVFTALFWDWNLPFPKHILALLPFSGNTRCLAPPWLSINLDLGYWNPDIRSGAYKIGILPYQPSEFALSGYRHIGLLNLVYLGYWDVSWHTLTSMRMFHSADANFWWFWRHWHILHSKHVSCVMLKQVFRSLSLSYQKKAWFALSQPCLLLVWHWL